MKPKEIIARRVALEFKDGDEGSEVSGINLGLIKLKSRNK